MALDSLSQGMQTAASCIVAIPSDEYRRAGVSGFLKSVVFQAAPRCVIRPLVGTSQAVSRAALGLRNQLQPQKHQESEEKYKSTRF
jgi:autophagy-related protein 2